MAPGSDLRQAGAARGRPVAVLLTALTGLVGAVVMLAVTAAPAAAHNALASTTPADGSTVQQAPAEIVLTFNQPALALGTGLIVTDPTGQQIQTGEPKLVDNTVTQTLRPGPAGAYTVLWRVTSADGHPISGQLTFNTEADSASSQVGSTSSPADTPPGPDQTDSVSALPWVAVLGMLAVVAVVLTALRRRLSNAEKAGQAGTNLGGSGPGATSEPNAKEDNAHPKEQESGDGLPKHDQAREHRDDGQ